MAFTSSRAGGTGAAGQIYLAQWNHEAAMAALKAAPAQASFEEIDPAATDVPRRTRRHGASFKTQDSSSLAIAAACLLAVPQRIRRRPHRRGRKTHVETLASDKFEGRLTGSPGEKLAADYLISRAEAHGREAAAGHDRLPHAVHVHRRLEGRRLDDRVTKNERRRRRIVAGSANVLALSFSDSGEVTGDVVFAGYGLVVPDSQNFGYDSYAGLDVKDKIVVVLRYFPEDADQKTRGDSRALRRPSLQGAGGAAARRQGHDRRHRPAIAQRRRRGADEF